MAGKTGKTEGPGIDEETACDTFPPLRLSTRARLQQTLFPQGPTVTMSDARELEILTRIADAFERIAPPPAKAVDLGDAEGFVWNAEAGQVDPVRQINRVDISLLKGVGPQTSQLRENTDRFARGLPANNALLWGSTRHGQKFAGQGSTC